MNARNAGLTVDALFVGATRPPMRWGVTYMAVMCNMLIVMEVFIVTKNLLTLLIAVPVHGVCMMLCAREARFFDLLVLWVRTRLPAVFANLFYWKSSSYSPLALELPDAFGRRARKSTCVAYVCKPRAIGADGRTSWAR